LIYAIYKFAFAKKAGGAKGKSAPNVRQTNSFASSRPSATSKRPESNNKIFGKSSFIDEDDE